MRSSHQLFKIIYPTRQQIIDNDEHDCPDIYNHFSFHGKQIFMSLYPTGYRVISSGYCPKELLDKDPYAAYNEYNILFQCPDFQVSFQRFLGYCRKLLIGEWSLTEDTLFLSEDNK